MNMKFLAGLLLGVFSINTVDASHERGRVTETGQDDVRFSCQNIEVNLLKRELLKVSADLAYNSPGFVSYEMSLLTKTNEPLLGDCKNFFKIFMPDFSPLDSDLIVLVSFIEYGFCPYGAKVLALNHEDSANIGKDFRVLRDFYYSNHKANKPDLSDAYTRFAFLTNSLKQKENKYYLNKVVKDPGKAYPLLSPYVKEEFGKLGHSPDLLDKITAVRTLVFFLNCNNLLDQSVGTDTISGILDPVCKKVVELRRQFSEER